MHYPGTPVHFSHRPKNSFASRKHLKTFNLFQHHMIATDKIVKDKP